MTSRRFIVAFPVMIVIVVLIVGCGGRSGTPAPSSRPAAPSQARGSALGTEQTAGPFQVTLTTEPAAPKVGQVRFIAMVMRDAKMVKDAKVTLELAMASMEGTSVVLSQAGEQYESTANVGMAGEWTAKVTVSAANDTGTATYTFSATRPRQGRGKASCGEYPVCTSVSVSD